MVKNPRRALFATILEDIRRADNERVKAILESIQAEIPPPVDVAALRGPGWWERFQTGAGAEPPPVPPGTVDVEVLNAAGLPAAGAVVDARDASNVLVATRTVPEDGHVLLELPPGTYAITAKLLDATGSAGVVLASGAAVSVRIVVLPPAGPPPPGGPPGPPPEPTEAPAGAATSAVPAPLAPAATEPAPTGFSAGDRVLVYAALPGTILSVPDAPDGLYLVRLDAGYPVLARASDLRRL